MKSPAKIKGANKDGKIYVGRSTTIHNLLFCAHTLCVNYITKMFLLASSSIGSKQLLCFVRGPGEKNKQKLTTKKFVGFHNHSSLLTMFTCSKQFPEFWLQFTNLCFFKPSFFRFLIIQPFSLSYCIAVLLCCELLLIQTIFLR